MHYFDIWVYETGMLEKVLAFSSTSVVVVVNDVVFVVVSLNPENQQKCKL